MRILVTGGRSFTDEEFVEMVMSSLRVDVVVVGDCPTGVDHLVAQWCRKSGIVCHSFYADWDVDGNSAGPKRNSRMIRDGKPNLVVAFPGGKGTEDCATKAARKGIPVFRVSPVVKP